MITAKVKGLLILSTMIVGQLSMAKGEWDNFREATPEALFGSQARETVVTENNAYLVRSGKLNSLTKELIYRCQGVNTSLEMIQFQGMVLTNGVTMSSLYSKSTGKLVSVLAQGRVVSQGKTKDLIMALYANDCSVDSFTKTYFGYRPSQNVGNYNPRTSVPMDPAMPQNVHYAQSCHIDIQLLEKNSDKGYVAISCNNQAKARVFVKEGSTILCDQKSYVGPSLTRHCDFERDATRPSTIQVEVSSENRTFTAAKKFSKAASFAYPVQAAYEKTNSHIVASSEAESIPFRGTSFKAEIKVTAEDNDILKIDPENEIQIDLINVKTGKIVAQRYISSGDSTTFLLTGFYEVPRFIGQPHWSTMRTLQGGINEFAVVVHDAYQRDDTDALRLETIKIELPELGLQ